MKAIREFFSMFSLGCIMLILVIVIPLALITATYALKPVWLGFEREAIESSIQYHESRKAELRTYYESYLENETRIAETDNDALIDTLQAQNKSALVEMRRIADELGNKTPDYAVRFLATHR